MTNVEIVAAAEAAFQATAPKTPPVAHPPSQEDEEQVEDSSEDQETVEVKTDEPTFELGGKKLSWAEALAKAPPDVAELMKGMQASFTKKSQELAVQKKDLARERESLFKNKPKTSTEPLPEYDPYDEASVAARIELEVAKRIQEMIAPMEEEHATIQAEEKYQTFLSENPDFETDKVLRAEVQKSLQANEGLDLETAYWAAKGRLAKQMAAKTAEQAKAKAAAQRQAAYTGSGPAKKSTPAARPVMGDLKKMSNEQIMRLAETLSNR